MNQYFFDLPLFISGPAIIVSFGLFALGGLLLVRRFILPHINIQFEDSEFSGTLAQSVMVFYGLSVGLIAVSVFQTYSETSHVISNEATSMAGLYRDVSGYPESNRSRLRPGFVNMPKT